MLSVRLENDFSCNTKWDWRPSDMFVTFVLADKCGTLRRCQILMVVGEKDGREGECAMEELCVCMEVYPY